MRVGDAYVHLSRGYGGAVLAQGCDGDMKTTLSQGAKDVDEQRK